MNFAAAIAATAAGSSPTGATTKGGTNSHSTTSNIIIARPIATSSTPALRFHRGDGVLSAKSGEVAVLIGQIADRVLKYVGDRMPGLEALTISTLDTIFAPRLVLRHLMVVVALQTGLLTWNGLVAIANRLLARMSRRNRDAKSCRQRMRTAADYEEWKEWAERLDELEGHAEWRKRSDSLLYDHKVLQQQINDLNAMMNSEDVFGLMFRLRGSLSRNQHGMLHEGLFSRAHAGTKVLVERYHEVVCEALHYVCAKNAVAQDIPTDVKLAFFNETRHAYGRTALMLSGGAAMGIYHAGVVKALLERKLLPRVISGASAGSIVAAMVGTRTDLELRPMIEGRDVNLAFFQPLRTSSRRKYRDNKYKNEAFWQLLVPPALRWMGERLWNVLLHSDGFLKMDTDYFRTILRHNIGPATFQEAFDRTGRIVNITVAPRNRTDPPRLLNYLTAPHVLVWSAAVCSSSVPGVFEPSPLLVKDADGSVHPEFGSGEKFVDGSMEADLPMQQISELFNINHFIVSQVNPHASLLSTMALPKSVWSPPIYSFLVGIVGFLQAQVRNWLRNVIELVSLRRMAPVWASKRGGIQLLTQEYEGRHCDVTITPWEGEESILSSFAKMLSNVSIPEFLVMVEVAERNTWPKVEMIRSHCAVEMGLEQCVQTLRRQLTAENQVRMLAPAAQHTSLDSLRRRGRVPSFYTSRSIVNLSGLNVTDPSIVFEHLHATDSTAAANGMPTNGMNPALSSSRHQQPLFGSGSRLSTASEYSISEADERGDDVGLSMDGHLLRPPTPTLTPPPPPPPPHHDEHRRPRKPYTPVGTPPQRRVDDTEASWREAGTGTFGIGLASSFQGAAGYPLVDGSEAVASGDEAAAAAAAARAGGDGRVLTEDADLGWLTGSDLEALGLAPQETVVKSTSMAKFYYRRSQSMDASMNEMHQKSTSSGNLSTHSEPTL